jgi:hypothetical protein
LINHWHVNWLLSCQLITDMSIDYWHVNWLLTCQLIADMSINYWSCQFITDVSVDYWCVNWFQMCQLIDDVSIDDWSLTWICMCQLITGHTKTIQNVLTTSTMFMQSDVWLEQPYVLPHLMSFHHCSLFSHFNLLGFI